MDDVLQCISSIEKVLNDFKVKPGGVTHAVEQIREAVQQAGKMQKNATIQFEQEFATTVGNINVSRIVDIVATDLTQRVHTEVKSGKVLKDALNLKQMTEDAALAIQSVMKRQKDEAVLAIQNVWKFSQADFGEKIPLTLRRHVDKMVTELKSGGLGDHINDALKSFNFVDKFGRTIKAELNSKGELIFKNALGQLFDAKGAIAKEATRQAGNSPDFRPAMQALFGPSGQVASAARGAAQRSDLQPALRNLENKIEQGVGSALNRAGNAVSAKGARELGAKIGAGATALGGIFTAIPSFKASISSLGDAWNKPLNSTEAYMNLFTQLGGAIGEGVQLFQALGGVTKIASAAQAVFNAVMAMNPIVLIVLAVMALIAAIVALIYYWDQVKAALRDNPWLAVAVALTGIIGLIVVVIAYWDEIKLAVLKAANFISIQLQRIGAFFVGLGNLISQVWSFITASIQNFFIGIINAFVSMGVGIVNFFIGFANRIIGLYNKIAKYVPGLSQIEKIAEVDVESKMIPLKETPEISVEAAFARAGQIQGGLEGTIAEQEKVVLAAQREDERRRAQQTTTAAAPATPATPAAPGAGALVAPAAPTLPAVATARGAAESVDRSVRVDGGITVNINADRLELDAAEVLSEEIVRRLKERLDALRMEQDFQTGIRSSAAG